MSPNEAFNHPTSPAQSWPLPAHQTSPVLPSDNPVELSIAIPLHNEELNIDYLFERLEGVVNQLGASYEIVCVDDGSRDKTWKRLVEHHCRNPRIKAITLSRNFGKEIALTAAINYTTGAAVIPIDADLQDPPELIGDMLALWRDGYDVVYATRRSRSGESWFKKFTADAFYRIIEKLSPIAIPRNTGDFRLMDRRVVEILKQMPERGRFMKGLFSWVGFKQTSILFDRQPRHQGQTTWNYWKLWNFAVGGIVSFSTRPLKIWSYMGLALSLVAFLYALFLIVRTMILGTDVPGYASLMVAILLLGGIQLISLGVIGEYLARVYEEVKGRPLYIVRESYGVELPPPVPERPL